MATTTHPRLFRYGVSSRSRSRPAATSQVADRPPAAVSDPRSFLEGQCRATSLQAQQMHHAVADQTFGALHWVPGLSAPARLVQSTHDALSHGLYAAFRQGCGALFSWAGQAEQWIAAGIPGLQAGPAPDAAAGQDDIPSLNRMSLHLDGRPLYLGSRPLQRLRERVCLFVHGLACDEHSWHFDPGAWAGAESAGMPPGPWHYGALLSRDLGFSPLYLRYNTSLGLDDNARHLSTLLFQLVAAAPAHVRELVLIGHSLGGLLARRACEEGAGAGMDWTSRVSTVICLGSPALGASARLALPAESSEAPHTAHAGCRALRMVSGNLADDPAGLLLGRLLGDGFVSSTHRTHGGSGLCGDVQQVELAGLTHMALLNHPRVYALIRGWLERPA